MRKLFIIYSMLMFGWISCIAQVTTRLEDPIHPVSLEATPKKKPIDYRIPILKVLGFNMNRDLLMATPENYAYIASIAISFNLDGKVDSVYFPNVMSPALEKIIVPSNMKIKIKEIDFVFDLYKDKVILFPILFTRREDQKIDFASTFLLGFNNLWPELSLKDQNRKLVLLEPFINSFAKAH